MVGLRYEPLNLDSTSPGCACEGWGIADAGSGLTGYANQSGGNLNIAVESFSSPAPDRAISTVSISDPGLAGYGLRVTQDYKPSPLTDNLFVNEVTVKNTGTQPVTDLRYRRVMDWDVEPTAFEEWVTNQGDSPQLLFSSDDGFATSDPLAGRSYAESQSVCGPNYVGSCEFTDLGTGGEYPTVTAPADHGGLFDFGFGALAPGAERTFAVYYGAAPSEQEALDALATGGVQVYSMGQPNCTGDTIATCSNGTAGNSGPEEGKPASFMFGFITTLGDLSITKTDSPGPVLVGDELTYDLGIRNNGPEQAAGVQVTDELPAGVTLVSATPEQGTCSGTTTVSCDLGVLGNDSQTSIEIVVEVEEAAGEAGTITNTASVTGASSDANPTNNEASAQTPIGNQIPPETTIDSGPANGATTNDSTPTFGFSSSEAGSTFQCRVDTASFASCTTPKTLATLSDGSHTFEVKATDAAGEVDLTPASRTFTVDATAPNTTIDEGPANGSTTNDSTPTFSFSSSETGSTLQCRVDTASFASCTSPKTLSTLSDGSHTFEVKATDAAGNTDLTPASRTFTVDATAPNTTISGGPADGATIGSPTPTYSFSSSETGSTLQCRVDTASFASCTSPKTLSTLSDGSHTFQVKATDAAGNEDLTPASRTVTVDTTAPETTIDSGPTDGSTIDEDEATFGFSSEAGAGFECRLDAASFGSCSSPKSYDGLADGSHTFEVRAVDGVNNRDATPGLADVHRRRTRLAASRDDDRQRPGERLDDHRPHPDVRLLELGGGVELQVPGRLRQLRQLHVAEHGRTAEQRRPHLRGQGDRRSGQRGPERGEPQLHRRCDRAGDDDRHRPGHWDEDQRLDSHLRLLELGGRLELQVPGRLGRLRQLHLAEHGRPAERWAPHLRGAGHRCRGQRRCHPGCAQLHRRRHPAEHPDHEEATGGDQEQQAQGQRVVQLPIHRAGIDVPLQHRRRRLRDLHVSRHLLARPRRARLQGGRRRQRRERRSDPGDGRVHDQEEAPLAVPYTVASRSRRPPAGR